MNALINYLLDNLMLDFQGDLSVDMVRDFLRDDKSRDADSLRSKIIEYRSTTEMMITLADCLKEHLPHRDQRGRDSRAAPHVH